MGHVYSDEVGHYYSGAKGVNWRSQIIAKVLRHMRSYDVVVDSRRSSASHCIRGRCTRSIEKAAEGSSRKPLLVYTQIPTRISGCVESSTAVASM